MMYLINIEDLPVRSIDVTDLPSDGQGLMVVLLEDLNKAPHYTVDSNFERPHGKWVFDGCDDVTCKCMFCGHEHVYVTSPKADGINFCEQCGADMRGETE